MATSEKPQVMQVDQMVAESVPCPCGCGYMVVRIAGGYSTPYTAEDRQAWQAAFDALPAVLARVAKIRNRHTET